jgi:hypothetical protein
MIFIQKEKHQQNQLTSNIERAERNAAIEAETEGVIKKGVEEKRSIHTCLKKKGRNNFVGRELHLTLSPELHQTFRISADPPSKFSLLSASFELLVLKIQKHILLEISEVLTHILVVCLADLVDDALALVALPASAAAVVRQLAMRAILLQPAADVGLGVAHSEAVVLTAHLTVVLARVHGHRHHQQTHKNSQELQQLRHCCAVA